MWKSVGTRKEEGLLDVRWVDVDKGFGVVAKDFKPKSKVIDQEGLPLDVSKAHLHAPMLDEEFVQLPPERWTEGECARLIYTLYGMRTVASNWEKEYSNTLEMVAFCPGRATVVAFYHAEREVRIVVHVVEGRQSDLEWVPDVLAAKYILKVKAFSAQNKGIRKASWYCGGSWTGAQMNSGGRVIRGMSREFCRCVEWFQEIRRSFQESSCRRRTGMRRSLLERI